MEPQRCGIPTKQRPSTRRGAGRRPERPPKSTGFGRARGNAHGWRCEGLEAGMEGWRRLPAKTPSSVSTGEVAGRRQAKGRSCSSPGGTMAGWPKRCGAFRHRMARGAGDPGERFCRGRLARPALLATATFSRSNWASARPRPRPCALHSWLFRRQTPRFFNPAATKSPSTSSGAAGA